MIDVVVIVILLALLVAVFTSSIPPKQENLPEYRFQRVPKPAAEMQGAEAGPAGAARNSAIGSDAGGRS